MPYEVRIESGHAFDSSMQLRPTWLGKVVYVEAGGQETFAISVQSEWQTDTGKRRVRGRANEQRRRLEHHYTATGHRWEVMRKAEAEAKQAREKTEREARRRVNAAAPELLAALRDLLAEARNWQDEVRFAPAAIANAEAAIRKATEEPKP
jgi:hypothetical protein